MKMKNIFQHLQVGMKVMAKTSEEWFSGEIITKTGNFIIIRSDDIWEVRIHISENEDAEIWGMDGICACGEHTDLIVDGVSVCKKHIAEVIQCEDCGRLTAFPNTVSISHGEKTIMVCNECSLDYKRCRACRKLYAREDLTNGLCQSCLEEGYEICDWCDEVVHPNYKHYLNGEVYCSRCFNDRWFVCEFCGRTFHRHEARETLEGAICAECAEGYEYCNSCGQYFPSSLGTHNDSGSFTCLYCDKPYVKSAPADPEEIEEVITLLLSSTPKKTVKLNSYNPDDFGLSEIVKAVGPVQWPIYLFGLKNRAEYGISCSYDVLKKLAPKMTKIGDSHYLNTPMGNIKVVQIGGYRKLGICLDLRKYFPEFVAQLVREITTIRKEVG